MFSQSVKNHGVIQTKTGYTVPTSKGAPDQTQSQAHFPQMTSHLLSLQAFPFLVPSAPTDSTRLLDTSVKACDCWDIGSRWQSSDREDSQSTDYVFK